MLGEQPFRCIVGYHMLKIRHKERRKNLEKDRYLLRLARGVGKFCGHINRLPANLLFPRETT